MHPMARVGMVRSGVAWLSAMLCGVAWLGEMLCGVVWCGVVLPPPPTHTLVGWGWAGPGGMDWSRRAEPGGSAVQ